MRKDELVFLHPSSFLFHPSVRAAVCVRVQKETCAMVRSKWRRTLAATLAWAGLACGQQRWAVWAQAPAPAPLDRTERVITGQETGKPAQKCKLLKSWRTPEGAQAYQVQALDSGGLMTIAER